MNYSFSDAVDWKIWVGSQKRSGQSDARLLVRAEILKEWVD